MNETEPFDEQRPNTEDLIRFRTIDAVEEALMDMANESIEMNDAIFDLRYSVIDVTIDLEAAVSEAIHAVVGRANGPESR